jgi:Protein of unknown function (DUF2911)
VTIDEVLVCYTPGEVFVMGFPSLRLSAVLLCCCAAGVGAIPSAFAQAAPKFVSPPAKAEVALPAAKISVDYCAPSIHGRTIFGGLVPYGEVWRTGANAATTLKTSGDLQIGDLKVPAGTYTLYSLPSQDGWKLVVNKQTGQWGTVYDKTKDLGRVTMETGSTASPLETMVIDFEKTMGNATELHVKWAGVDASVAITAQK